MMISDQIFYTLNDLADAFKLNKALYECKQTLRLTYLVHLVDSIPQSSGYQLSLKLIPNGWIKNLYNDLSLQIETFLSNF